MDKEIKSKMNKWLNNLDIQNWTWFYHVIKELIELKPDSVLEIGEGCGAVRKMCDFVYCYHTMDTDAGLNPMFNLDIREEVMDTHGIYYDCTICTNVLEHIPFEDFQTALQNIYFYTKPGGHAIIGIPHRAWYVNVNTWLGSRLFRFPDFLRRWYHFGKNPIDTAHEWEIGDGKHTVKDVEEVFKKVGFKIVKYKKLMYDDIWVLVC